MESFPVSFKLFSSAAFVVHESVQQNIHLQLGLLSFINCCVVIYILLNKLDALHALPRTSFDLEAIKIL